MNAASRTHPTRILIAMSACMALQMTGLVMLQPLFARRFESFGAGVQALGLSAMAYALTTTLFAPFAGLLADRIGRRPVVLLSLSTYVLAFCGFLFATSAWMLIVLRGLAGVCTAGLVPAMTGSLGDLAPQDRRAQWMGILNGGASAGWVAPVLGGLLYDRFGYVAPFTTAIFLAVGALLLAAFQLPETRKAAIQAAAPRLGLGAAWRALPARGTLLLLLLISLSTMLAWGFIEPQLVFYAYDDLGWSSSRLGLAISAYGLAFMLGEFTLGRSSDRLGRKPVLILGLALFLAQFFGLVFSRQFGWIVFSFIIAGLGNALYDPALNALVLDVAPPAHTATLLGLKSTAGSLGGLLGPALVVLFTPWLSPRMIFLLPGVYIFVLFVFSGLALPSPERLKNRQVIPETAVER